MSSDLALLRKRLRKLPREKKEAVACYVYELRRRKNDPLKSYREKYFGKPLSWVQDFVDINLPEYMRKVLQAIEDGYRRIAIHGPHGIGKSVFGSLIVPWAGSTSTDCKIPTTASAWRQLEKYLWPEIHKWNAKIHWEKIGIAPNLLTLSEIFAGDSQAFAVASDNAATIEGAHAVRVVYIFDEAKAIPVDTWVAAQGAFSTEGDHIHIALSTPGDCSGVFYDICSRKTGYEKWKVIHVSARDAIRAGRMSISWAREMRSIFGKDSPVYQNRVWGLFAKDSDDSVIPLSWVDAAIERWHRWKDEGCKREGVHIIGADTAGQGVDKTVFAHRFGKVITHLDRFGKSRPMECAGQLKIAMGADAKVHLDVCFGEGAGTADRLKEFPECAARVIPVKASEGTDQTDRSGHIHYANVRAAMWWNMREMLDPENKEEICLPDDPLLIGDLTAPRRKFRSNGDLLIESKDDIKARIGRSTDDGDAVVQAFYHPRQVDIHIVGMHDIVEEEQKEREAQNA